MNILSNFLLLWFLTSCANDSALNGNSQSADKKSDSASSPGDDNLEGKSNDQDPDVPGEGEESSTVGAQGGLETDCGPGESLVGEVCVVSKYKACREFVELDTTTILSIEKSGKCYFKKVTSKMETQPSGQGVGKATDVISALHGLMDGNATGNPWVLADYSNTLTFDIEEGESKRTISIAGDFVATEDQISKKPVMIDNFLLIEIKPDGAEPVRFARGTDDSVPASGFITVNGENVTDFIGYAPGGVAEIETVDISANFPSGVPTDIRFRMLDAGVSASASDLFLIIH